MLFNGVPEQWACLWACEPYIPLCVLANKMGGEPLSLISLFCISLNNRNHSHFWLNLICNCHINLVISVIMSLDDEVTLACTCFGRGSLFVLIMSCLVGLVSTMTLVHQSSETTTFTLCECYICICNGFYAFGGSNVHVLRSRLVCKCSKITVST